MVNKANAKKYCSEDISKIENYDKAIADTTQTWICHHRTEIWWNCTRKDLIENECYYGRKALELIFLTPSEHRKLHHAGKTLSDETKKKISDAKKGKTHGPHSEETKKKISESKKGQPRNDETKRKISEIMKGKSRKPFTDEHRRKMSEAQKAYWAKRKEGGK